MTTRKLYVLANNVWDANDYLNGANCNPHRTDLYLYATEEEAEQKAKQAEKEAMARQDSIAAVQQQKADEDKKRNMWLMIGGVILAILGFIGNQAFQHFRNMKNQKSMMEMQQSVVKRAETEAKRRAQSMVRSKISQVKNEARTKSRNIVNDNIKNIGKVKKNKGVSI